MSSVSIFTPTLDGVGGAERYIVNLSSGLSNRGYQVEIVSGNIHGLFSSDLPPEVDTCEIQVPSVPVAGSSSSLVSLYQYFKNKCPDNFISVMNHANIPSALAHQMSRSNSNLILTEHNNPKLLMSNKNSYKYKNKLIYEAAKHLYGHADHVVGVSQGVAEDLSDILPHLDNIRCIYNPVVSEKITEKSLVTPDHWMFEDDIPVIIGAKPEVQKNLTMLVESFSAIIEEREAYLLIVGSGEQIDEIKLRSQELGVEDYTDICGIVPDIYSYLGSADVFASTSNWEGLPTIHIEALACGTPVVATDCPSGPREILGDGKYGKLVPVEDREKFSKALLDVLKSPPEKDKLIGRADSFSIHKSVDMYEKILV
ncbi:glycosyltransferase [Haloferax gibbonsii]|uniref:glycosyltransferase n=1 Tax=Haloferax gibbonsii TaxID=35746 RepID=UPI0009E4867F|nr:glycosyltransferase [Haloferax gibbonsii]